MKINYTNLLTLSLLGLLVSCNTSSTNSTPMESISNDVSEDVSETIVQRPTADPTVSEEIVIEGAYIEKLNDNQSIVIDGEMEDVWNDSYTFNMTEEIDGKTMSVAPAEAKAMWTEEGLYFIGKVYDNTIVGNDRIDFWISETLASKYSSDGQYSTIQTDGEYGFGIKNDLQIRHLVGFDVNGICEIAVKQYENYYIAEAYMPKLSEGNYKSGQKIGFEVCTNHYEEGTGRLFCVPWKNIGPYWEDVGSLNELILGDLN